ncbi:MAG: ABC transporter ATP-binding protein [Sporomusaceae bacterium]|nr:ABC transporter ATP-binding protein [Sporomusaceae bacterium]
MSAPLIQMRGIVKTFPGVVANDQVNLDIHAGEIHALLGENGSGKSTLMSVLAGLYRPDAGSIAIEGKSCMFSSPRDAIRCGIGMIHQHFKLVEPFTVIENMMLGENRSLWLEPARVRQEIRSLGERFGLEVNPDALISQLSVGEKQRVEILRALYQGSRVLIMDEPTAVLTPQETCELFANLKLMASDGCAVVFITHKMHEVHALADRVTVLRGGRISGQLDRSQLDTDRLVRLMVGRDVAGQYEREDSAAGKVALQLDNVTALNDMGLPGLSGLSLTLRQGEILGLAGVAGNGQRELAEVIAGLRGVASGRVTVFDEDVTNSQAAAMINRGVSYVPEDRLGVGLAPDLDIYDNLLLKSYRKPEASGRWLLRRRLNEEKAVKLVRQHQVKLASLRQPVRLLSGGNLQKLLLAREIAQRPRLMVVVYPARGLDVGATEAVHKLLLTLRAGGTAILLISEDLEEIMKLADRVGVLYKGGIAGEFAGDAVDVDMIGHLMAGSVRLAGGEMGVVPICG